MDEKKRVRVYEAEVIGLPSLRLVLGDIPSPDPERQHKPYQQTLNSSREVKGTVKRIIAHLEEE